MKFKKKSPVNLLYSVAAENTLRITFGEGVYFHACRFYGENTPFFPNRQNNLKGTSQTMRIQCFVHIYAILFFISVSDNANGCSADFIIRINKKIKSSPSLFECYVPEVICVNNFLCFVLQDCISNVPDSLLFCISEREVVFHSECERVELIQVTGQDNLGSSECGKYYSTKEE